ncbi:MAG TPA: hypothetical protein PK324_23595 [Nocardioides sp.]|jgi:hypothetical protein|uniref:hypothetical protein n=1 Tax=uncultured Nocardioides sp. TaxID=198441 RepID=UPI00262C61D9|nr:hypothetical protein [uncultured Nocardioides sp.]HRK48634.1 hypothetical protein [Nocardioides sp.]
MSNNPLHPGGRMPDEATWEDYLNAHGGPLTPGWWVTLGWYADPGHPRPEVVGPYSSYAQAVSAMEDSLLIDGFATDTNREEWLDDVYVAADPASIARMCADYGPRVTLIDPGDHHHFGTDEPDSGPSRAGGCRPELLCCRPELSTPLPRRRLVRAEDRTASATAEPSRPDTQPTHPCSENIPAVILTYL